MQIIKIKNQYPYTYQIKIPSQKLSKKINLLHQIDYNHQKTQFIIVEIKYLALNNLCKINQRIYKINR